MLIVCPNCATSYQVEPASLGAAGRSVRCVRCKKVWFAANTESMAEISRSFQQDMAAFAAPDQPSDPPPSQPPAEQPAPEHPAAEIPSIVPSDTPPADTPTADPAYQPLTEDVPRDDRGPQAMLSQPSGKTPPEPVTVDDAPSLAAQHPDTASKTAADPTPENIESVAARRIRRPPPRRRSQATGKWPVVAMALVAINLGLIAWRTDIVRALPQMASFYAAIGLKVNLRNLVFSEFATHKDTQDGAQMLIVEGVLKNTSRGAVAVPRLRFSVRNEKGQEIYSWTALPTRNVIAPEATMPFRSRLASPPADTHTVLVRFFNRRDLVAGAQ
jgi:predicted Zn finger-like uncharacterized protein